MADLLEVEGTVVRFADDLAQTLDTIDRICRENLAEIDDFIATNAIDAPEDELVPINWQPSCEPPTFDLTARPHSAT
jgi:putative flavoprotein involved in K+ transport